jgi:type VI secretion system protein ImpE
VPLEHIASVEIEAPKRLRDLIWAPAIVRTGEAFRGRELGEVLVPALAPFSFQDEDDAMRLGRASGWRETDSPDEPVPTGQKMFRIDEEEAPFLELRHLEIRAASPVDQHATAR